MYHTLYLTVVPSEARNTQTATSIADPIIQAWPVALQDDYKHKQTRSSHSNAPSLTNVCTLQGVFCFL